MAVRVWTRSSLFGSLFRPNTIRKCTKTTKFDPHECVIVRQAAAATTVPAMSPFPIKLETYLRLANIPYKNRFGGAMSTKGKIPWIQYKDDVIADSNFCIKYLNEKFSVDLDADLSRSEKGIARSMMTMLEENTYWTVVYHRWIECTQETVDLLFQGASPLKKKIIAYVGKRRVMSYLHGQGMGRHSRDEIYYIASCDLEAISGFLSDKPFLMGEKPTIVDTSAFGCLANVVWHDVKSPQHSMINSNFTNLKDYCVRMKELVWPDWDDEIEKRKAIARRKK